MGLLDDNAKANFDTTFIAEYDSEGDNSILNPQPLQVDDEGNLKVYMNGGLISSSMIAYSQDRGNAQVTCDNQGALNQGGLNISNAIDLQSFSQGATYSTYLLAYTGIQTLRNAMIADMRGHGYNKMYNYAENVIAQGSNFYVFVSCYGGN